MPGLNGAHTVNIIILHRRPYHDGAVPLSGMGWVGLVNVPKCHQGSGGWSEGGGESTTGIASFPPCEIRNFSGSDARHSLKVP